MCWEVACGLTTCSGPLCVLIVTVLYTHSHPPPPLHTLTHTLTRTAILCGAIRSWEGQEIQTIHSCRSSSLEAQPVSFQRQPPRGRWHSRRRGRGGVSRIIGCLCIISIRVRRGRRRREQHTYQTDTQVRALKEVFTASLASCPSHLYTLIVSQDRSWKARDGLVTRLLHTCDVV